MSRNLDSVEIVSWDKKRLDLKKDNLINITSTIPSNLPIAILNVSGEFRTGKSTLLNLIISILLKYEKCRDVCGFHIEDLRLDCGCLNGSSSNSSGGFGWRAGNEPCTKGIRMLNHYFVIPNPANKSKEMAVLLVDAEGLEANDSTNGSDQVLFGISNLMSSVLILNQKGIIGPSDMTNLRLLVEFCPPEKEKGNGSFCGIELLMRDYKYETEEIKDQLKEMEDFQRKLFGTREEALRNNLNVIKENYRYVDCFGLPQPGDDIECEDFKGNMDDFSDEFKEITLHYILELLTKKLHPTFGNKEEFSSLCETLNTFLSKGIPQLSQMHRIFIENKNQMVVNKIMTELINPLKEKFEKNSVNVEQLMKECDIALRKVEEYGSKFEGTEGMKKEKMDYIYGELMLLKKECENRKYHEKQIQLLEQEKNKTDEERRVIEQQRLECQRNNDRLNEEIQKLTLEIANRKPQEIHIHKHGGCIIQ